MYYPRDVLSAPHRLNDINNIRVLKKYHALLWWLELFHLFLGRCKQENYDSLISKCGIFDKKQKVETTCLCLPMHVSALDRNGGRKQGNSSTSAFLAGERSTSNSSCKRKRNMSGERSQNDKYARSAKMVLTTQGWKNEPRIWRSVWTTLRSWFRNLLRSCRSEFRC